MQLHELLRGISEIRLEGTPNPDISAVHGDSRTITPGALFVAIKGSVADGHDYFAEAVERGAAAAIGERPGVELPIPYFQVTDSRLALAQAGAAWHGFPSQRLTMIGVTGTDGKTTTAILIHSILEAAGIHAGLITSVSARVGETRLDTGLHVTTPGALEVQRHLSSMVEAGLTHCVLEATSHGLEQRRVAACDFDIAVVTNITHEHLDYHGSYESYRAAKGLLFSGLGETAAKAHGPPRAGILNRDDRSYRYLSEITPVETVTYGMSSEAAVVGDRVSWGWEGLSLQVESRRGSLPLQSPLLGDYNAANILAAYATTVEALGVPPERAASGIAGVAQVPGRMEVISLGQDFKAVVDFAHTPNALRRALETVRRLTEGRIYTVFGSAGLRDREKRRLMAEVSAALADVTILTAEDPRTESLDRILEEMASGARSMNAREGIDFWRIPDRAEALRFAVSRAEEGDLVLACGKGHEQSMCFGETEYPWDDRVAMRAALAERLSVDGPAMPFLPTSIKPPL